MQALTFTVTIQFTSAVSAAAIRENIVNALVEQIDTWGLTPDDSQALTESITVECAGLEPITVDPMTYITRSHN